MKSPSCQGTPMTLEHFGTPQNRTSSQGESGGTDGSLGHGAPKIKWQRRGKDQQKHHGKPVDKLSYET